jgi:penicillin G amidase
MRLLMRGLGHTMNAIGASALLIGALAGAAIFLTIPRNNLTAQIAALKGPVSISIDRDGIPRIGAGSEHDAAVALGFLHARERLFQMDLMRRAASGRLSEIAGPATLNIDRLMRTLGLRQHALADYADLPEDTGALLQAYADGVNAWIRLKGRFAAPEFLALGVPESWEPVDSLLWAKTMGMWLSMNWRQELGRLALAGRLSPQKLDELWPRQSGVPSTTATVSPAIGPAASRLAASLPAFPDAYTLPQTASNEWAVDGRHTDTGAPLLAGDPHLAFGFPGIWYLARIDTPGHTLVGATAPGVPFLVLGHNGKIAWTFTTTGADVQDVYVETPAGPTAYQTPEGPRPYAVRQERIAVRGQPDQVLTVRETRHGPVISDLDSPDGPILAVRMGNLQGSDTAAAGLLALNRADTVEKAGSAAAEITSPVQNLLVADRQTIGIFVTGRVPIRAEGDGAAPATGGGMHEWIGWASGARLPHIVGPDSGRLVNANEPLTVPGFDVFLGRDEFGAWRADRIRQMLDQTDQYSVTKFAAMQVDHLNLFALRILPILTAVPPVDGPTKTAIDLLKGWDGTASMNAPEPLIFNAWITAFYDAVIHHAGVGRGLGAPVADFVRYVLTEGQSDWCDGNCQGLLQESLATTLMRLRRRFGDDPHTWDWGKAHIATFDHPLLRGLVPFGTLSIPSAGDDDTVGAGGFDAEFRSVHGASYRGVYDLQDLNRSQFIMAPGQSGNLFSRHAGDILTRWRDGATITIGPDPDRAEGLVQLTP